MKKILGLIILSVLLLTGCGPREGTITFGAGNLEDGILNERSTFYPEDDFMLEANLAKPFDSSEIRLVTLKHSKGMETMYEEWYETVDPSWDWLVYEFHITNYEEEFEKGHYIVRMYTNETNLIAEGGFSIK